MVPGDAPDTAAVLAVLVNRPAWHQDAACRGAAISSYVLSPAKGQWAEYDRSRCQDCPVRQECLETALANPDLAGLWGGTTPTERKAMRRERVA